jgi:predicted Rossmann fold nucleotide-binding protein DprA/Smf involved in DNA uptake
MKEKSMKLVIVGSRSITEFDLTPFVPDDIDLIISGGAAGVDTVAEKYADTNRLSKLILRPQYKKYARAVPILRNEVMVDMADAVLVIWDGVSKGTRATIRYALKQGKPVTVVGRDGTV